MTRPSSIDTLPPDVLDALQAWLRDPAITQIEAVDRTNALLEEIGIEKRVTKSSLNRYAMRMEEAGAKLRQSREIAAMWIGKLGAQPQGQVGHLVNEMLRTLAFDMAMKLQDGEVTEESMPATIDMLKDLSLSVIRLEKAASENVKREAEIREQERAKAAEAAATTARKAGVSDETIERIRRDVLRMAE